MIIKTQKKFESKLNYFNIVKSEYHLTNWLKILIKNINFMMSKNLSEIKNQMNFLISTI